VTLWRLLPIDRSAAVANPDAKRKTPHAAPQVRFIDSPLCNKNKKVNTLPRLRRLHKRAGP